MQLTRERIAVIRNHPNDLNADEVFSLCDLALRSLPSPSAESDAVDLKAIRAYCDAATNGPWLTEPTPKDGEGWSTCSVVAAVARGQNIYAQPTGGIAPESNRVFIAKARTDLPACADEIERLRQRVAELEGVLEKCRSQFRDLSSNYDCDSACEKRGGYCRKCESAEVLKEVEAVIPNNTKGVERA